MAGTKDRLIEAGLRLFAEHGYHETSLADLRQAASAHSGSLYHAFSSKEALLVAVLTDFRDNIDRTLIGPAWEGVEDPLARVFALLGRYRDFLVATDLKFGCPIGSLALEIRDPAPEVRALLVGNFEAWTARVRACFEAVADRLPADVAPADLAHFTLTTMEGGVMLARTHRDLACFDRAVASLRNYVERLLVLAPEVDRQPKAAS
jgi:AcrR family transcriptional regulator